MSAFAAAAQAIAATERSESPDSLDLLDPVATPMGGDGEEFRRDIGTCDFDVDESGMYALDTERNRQSTYFSFFCERGSAVAVCAQFSAESILVLQPSHAE